MLIVNNKIYIIDIYNVEKWVLHLENHGNLKRHNVLKYHFSKTTQKKGSSKTQENDSTCWML